MFERNKILFVINLITAIVDLNLDSICISLVRLFLN